MVPGPEKSGIKKTGKYENSKKKEERQRTLWIFNDNIEQHNTNDKGERNEAIRVFNQYGEYIDHPYSAGISTGSVALNKGFQSLNESFEVTDFNTKKTKNLTVKYIIDENIKEIRRLIDTQKPKIQKVVYSVDRDGYIGPGTFNPDKNVKAYITKNINGLTENGVEVVPSVFNEKDKKSNFEFKIKEQIKQDNADKEKKRQELFGIFKRLYDSYWNNNTSGNIIGENFLTNNFVDTNFNTLYRTLIANLPYSGAIAADKTADAVEILPDLIDDMFPNLNEQFMQTSGNSADYFSQKNTINENEFNDISIPGKIININDNPRYKDIKYINVIANTEIRGKPFSDSVTINGHKFTLFAALYGGSGNQLGHFVAAINTSDGGWMIHDDRKVYYLANFTSSGVPRDLNSLQLRTLFYVDNTIIDKLHDKNYLGITNSTNPNAYNRCWLISLVKIFLHLPGMSQFINKK